MKITVIDVISNKIIGNLNYIPSKGDVVVIGPNTYEGIVDIVIHREAYNDVIVYTKKTEPRYMMGILEAFKILKGGK